MRGRFRIALGVCFLAACFLASQQAFAQLITADILGTVTDAAGAVIPGAKVTCTNTATGDVRNAESGASGDFVFNLLPPGPYSVSVEAPSFKKFISTVTIVAGDRARVNAPLQIGETTQSVEVTATTPALQTDSSTVQDTVTERAVQDLPLNGRNFITLVTNTVGAMAGPPGNIIAGNRPDDRRQTSAIAANGQNEIFNNQLVDGMDNNEREQGTILFRPSIDSIAEVKVDINNFSAEVGRAGGAVVNLITKAGTNELHGSVYEFFRNTQLNANDFFSNSVGTSRPVFNQNQFGGSVGGAIKKDKTFFFADIEELRTIQGTASGLLSTVTGYELAHPGDFSDVGGPVIPASQIDPISAKYFQLLPAANVPCAAPGTAVCATNNYSSVLVKQYYSTALDTRMDHRFGDKDSMFARFSYNPTKTVYPALFPSVNGISPGNGVYAGNSTEGAQSYMADYVHVFGPSLVVETKGGYTRLNVITLPPNYGSDDSNKFGIPNANVDPYASGLMTTSIAGYTGTGSINAAGSGNTIGDTNYLPILDINNVFQYNESLIWTKGRHNIKIGGGVIRRQLNYYQNSNGTGTFTWSSNTAGAPPNSMANFLEGVPTSITRQLYYDKLYLRTWEPSGYVQDDWHANRWLTLNLGLRWDHIGPLNSSVNQRSNYQLDTNTFCVGSYACVQPYWPVFEPRVGFAVNPGHGWVIRGGIGISAYPQDYASGSVNLGNPPFVSVNFTCQPAVVGGIACPAGIGAMKNGPPPAVVPNLNAPVGAMASHSDYTPPAEVYQYNLTFQKQIGANVFTASYVGELGRHLSLTWNANMPVPSGTSVQPKFLRAATVPGVQNISLYDIGGASEYNAAQFLFERRYAKGLTANINYTFARNITSVTDGSLTTPGTVVNNRGYDWNNADIGVKQRIAVRLNYELPFGKTSKGLMKQLIGGWQANMIGSYQTGLPYTVLDGQNLINLPNTTTDRPDIVAGQSMNAPNANFHDWINYNAFVQQPIGNPGTEARNQGYGPVLRVMDLSFFKDFALREKMKLQFRAEIYNFTNTENFAQPILTISKWTAAGPAGIPTNGGSFGQIVASNLGANPRQVQLALKLSF